MICIGVLLRPSWPGCRVDRCNTDQNEDVLAPIEILRTAFAIVFIGVVSAVFAISFAAIIYTGELAQFLDRGIGMALLGCVVLALVGSLTLSYRGAIVQIQDVPAILLAGGAATIVSKNELADDALFATVVAMTATATMSVGVVAFVLGHFRLAMIARYIPYPVVAGFLAATGVLLFLGGIGVAVGSTPHFGNFAQFFVLDVFLKWLPVAIAALFVLALVRIFPGELTLPLGLMAATCGFYALIWMGGHAAQSAQDAGLLLGPFKESGFLEGLGPGLLGQADWGAVMSQVPVILTIVAISLIGATLNSSGLELELNADFDVNDEVRGVGTANALAAFFGSFPGYHLLGETILANRLGLIGRLAGCSSALGCAAVLLLGANFLSVLPVGLFATVIAFLGLDLIYTWLWEARRQLRFFDYVIVALIPIIAVVVSFLAAVAAGLVLAFVLFVIAYARIDVVRSHSSVAVRRSMVERPDDQLAALARKGGTARILTLNGYLFFGSANLLRDRIQSLLEDVHGVRWLVLDFDRVSGLDISAWHVLTRLASDCQSRNVSLFLNGLNDAKSTGAREGIERTGASFYPDLNSAVKAIEDALLAAPEGALDEQTLVGALPDLLFRPEFAAFSEQINVADGEALISEGQATDDIYFLMTGQLEVSVPMETGASSVVAQIRPHSLVGEMAYYLGSERSAEIRSVGKSKLLRIRMHGLDELGKTGPELAAAFHRLVAQHMARRLRRTTLLVRDLGG